VRPVNRLVSPVNRPVVLFVATARPAVLLTLYLMMMSCENTEMCRSHQLLYTLQKDFPMIFIDSRGDVSDAPHIHVGTHESPYQFSRKFPHASIPLRTV
jgi:hypothetical protein